MARDFLLPSMNNDSVWPASFLGGGPLWYTHTSSSCIVFPLICIDLATEHGWPAALCREDSSSSLGRSSRGASE